MRFAKPCARRILIIAAVLSVACSRLHGSTDSLNLPVSMFVPGDGSLTPASDKLSPDCLSNSAFDACLYLKNPTAQEHKRIESSALEDVRRYGVKIRGLAGTVHLENPRIKVLTLNTPRFSLANPALLKTAWSPDVSYVEQLNAFYWANRTFEHLIVRLGEEHVPLFPLKIYVDDAFTGLATASNAVHLERVPGRLPAALSADVLVHLLGEALANELTGRKLFPGAFAQHKACGSGPRACCTSANGCSQALASSFGDYVAAMIFPSSPRLGEGLSGDPAGQRLCGIPRDLRDLAKKTKAELDSSCAGTPGLASLMGAWYASLWWDIRRQAEEQRPGAAVEIDRLFFAHARQWTGSSTFADAKSAALSLAGPHHALVASVLNGL